MPALVILLCLGSAVTVAASLRRRLDPGETGWRDALVWACVGTASWAALGAEVLSMGSHLSFGPVLAWWGIPAALLTGVTWRRRATLPTCELRGPDTSTRVIVAATLLVLLVTGVIGACTPPNTYDSIQYHLPRQVHWIQQGSVAHFPTDDQRELEMPPLAEFISAQLMILAGGEGGVNLIQWVALIGCAGAGSLIARDLGAGPRIQAVAALLVVANPGAATQAENAKNDVLVALWLVTLAYFGVRLAVQRACPAARLLMMGLALGLALLTKGTGYIFALPICALVGLWMLRSSGVRAIPAGLAIGLVAAALNLGHWERNYRGLGGAMGVPRDKSRYELVNSTFTPSAIASNLIRNISLHTCTPWNRVNAAEDRVIDAIHEGLGIDPDDPRTSFVPTLIPFHVRKGYDADGAGPAPVHLVLGLVALALGIRTVPRGPPRRAALIVFLPAVMFVFFCVVLKWQPWHARLHIPILTVLAPVAALALPAIRPRALRAVLLIAATGVCVVNIALNDAKPLLGPGSIFTHTWDELAFHRETDALAASGAAAAALARTDARVVAFAHSNLEFPAMRVFQRHLGPAMRAIVLSPRFMVPSQPPRPDAIVTWGRFGTESVRSSGGARYVAILQHLPVTLYVRTDLLRGPAPRLASAPFIGWSAKSGLDKLQGPFPKLDLPLVRWGCMPATRLEFESGGEPMYLEFECESNGMPGQAITVTLNGEMLYRHDFPPGRGFTAHRVALSPHEGKNEVLLSYELGVPNARPENRAVLFSRLQILPAEPATGPP